MWLVHGQVSIASVLGQVKVCEKSNEITAIPALLEVLDLSASLRLMRWGRKRRLQPKFTLPMPIMCWRSKPTIPNSMGK